MEIVRTTAIPVRAGAWRKAYPVLLRCIAEGRRPSARDVETVAARILRELGRDDSGRSSRRTRQRALAAARIALEGQAGPPTAIRVSPVVPRGH